MQTYYSFSILISLVLFFSLKKTQSSLSIVNVIFVSASLFYSFSIIPLFIPVQGLHISNQMHLEGSGYIPTLAFSLLYLYAFVLLIIRCVNNFHAHPYKDFNLKVLRVGVIAVTLIVMIDVIRSQTFSIDHLNRLVCLINIMFLSMISAISIRKYPFNWHINAIRGLVIALFFISALGIFEIYNLRTWATFIDSQNNQIFRASSLFFNPNLLGLWSSIMYLFFSYNISKQANNKFWSFSGLLIAALAIYLSGSRSYFFILLLINVIALLLFRNRSQLLSTIILPFTIISTWLLSLLFNQHAFFHNMRLLGERFLFLPIHISRFVSDSAFGIKKLNQESKSTFPSDVLTSIEGRTGVGELNDGGWLLLFYDIGYAGCLVIGILYIYIFGKVMKIHFDSPNVDSVYSIMILLFIALVGCTNRIQMFPVFIYVAVLLIYPILLIKNTRKIYSQN